MFDFKITSKEKKKIKNLLLLAGAGVFAWFIIEPFRDFLKNTFSQSQFLIIGVVGLLIYFYIFKVK